MLCWVSRRLPATSMTFKDTGELGSGGVPARAEIRVPRKTVAAAAADADSPTINLRRVRVFLTGGRNESLDRERNGDIILG
jgi:hypothetical protein